MLELRRSPPFRNPLWENKPIPRKEPKNYFNSLKASGELEGKKEGSGRLFELGSRACFQS